MKKVFSLILVVMMLAAMFALSSSAIVGDGYYNYGEIANVERRSIRLDAVKEPVYDAATPIPIEYQSTKNYTTGTKYDITRKNGELNTLTIAGKFRSSSKNLFLSTFE